MQAYDPGWTEACFYKFFAKGVEGKQAQLLWSMVDLTTSLLNMGGHCLKYFDVIVRVGQGAPLSTYHFEFSLTTS
jgi:hypothetical protein